MDGHDDPYHTWLVYGGVNLLSSPLNDAWLLKISKSESGRLSWSEMDLRYDHGEVRCWHAASIVG